jgi:RNA polymerase sigma factor, sigma-70 family
MANRLGLLMMAMMAKVTPFSREDKCTTLELLRLYRQAPSEKLRERLVRLNIGLVKKEVAYWVRPHQDIYEDILQVGLLGLLGAIERFELHKGYAFSSFAVRYIRGEIQHYMRDRLASVRVPRRWLELYQLGIKTAQTLRNQLHREPTEPELIRAMQITAAEWQEVKLAHQNSNPISLDAPLQLQEDSYATLLEVLPDHESEQEETMQVRQALEQLDQRTREIVEYIYLEDLTQRQVAQLLGVSAVTISRQVKKGLDNLKGLLMAEAC